MKRYVPVTVLAAAILALAATTAISAPTSRAAGCAKVDRVSMRLSYLVFGAHIPYVVGKAKGFYAKNCIDVDIRKGRGSSAAVQLVGSGHETFGNAGAGDIMMAVSKGIPIITLADFYQDSMLALIATKQSGIKGPRDLPGHTMGLITGSVTTVLADALFNRYKIKPDSMKFVTVQTGGDAPLLLSHKMDAEVTNWTNDLIDWQVKYPQLKVNVWRLSSLGITIPGHTLFTSTAVAQQKPDLVRRFVAATIEAGNWAKAHPAEAVRILMKQYPELNAKAEALKWQADMSIMTKPFGSFSALRWQRMDNLFKKYGMISKIIPLNKLYTSQFLPKA